MFSIEPILIAAACGRPMPEVPEEIAAMFGASMSADRRPTIEEQIEEGLAGMVPEP